MKIGNNTFKGEVPRLAPRLLPENNAQEATNCRMLSGDLGGWRQFTTTKALTGITGVKTIFRIDGDTWLAFTAQTDVARATHSGGLDHRVLITSPSLFTVPRYTDVALATSGSEPYPAATHPLGVPAPSDIPTLVTGVDDTPTTFSVDITDEGGELAEKWVRSVDNFGIGGTFAIVSQSAGTGNPAPSYRLTYNETHAPGQQPWMLRNFGLGTASVVHGTAEVLFTDTTSVRNIAFLVAGDSTGAGVMVVVTNSALQIRKASEIDQYTAAMVAQTAVTTAGSIRYTVDVTIVVNEDNTQTVTAKLFDGVTQLATITGTSVFSMGDYCGFTAADASDAGLFTTEVDNIHIQASGSTGLTPTLVATNYLYTFVNNLGEESAPSFPTADVLRPDGVTITVTTSTSAPVHNAITYDQVTLKRIYRLISSNTGDLYRLVAEIPLATADFVDDIPDNELSLTVLESQDFDLPHDDMEGIIALPNGIYAGFVGQQLCLSAKGWPHAWPIQNRLPVDSDIVAINHIDNTIVVGTKTFVYTASGTDSSNYTMSKPGAPQSCVSKRGMTFLDGQGVVFPSPDGWCVCAGSAGQVVVATEGIFTKEQWEAQNPSSIVAAVHDGVLHWWYDNTEEDPDVLVLAFINSTSRSWDGTRHDGGSFTTLRPLTASAYATHQGNGKIRISQTGTYEVTTAWRMVSDKFGSDSCLVGVDINPDAYSSSFEKYPDQTNAEAETLIPSPILASAASHAEGVHRHILNVHTAPVDFYPRIYGEAYSSSPEYVADMVVTVRRSGASIYTPP